MIRNSSARQLNLSKTMREIALVAVAVFTVATTLVAQDRQNDNRNENEREKFAIGLWGDLPALRRSGAGWNT